MAEAPARSPEEVTLTNKEYKWRTFGGRFKGDGVYYERGGEYYPHFTNVGNGRFYEWEVRNNDVLLSATYNGKTHSFGDDKIYTDKNKFKNLNKFKEILRNKGTVTGINLKVLRNVTPTDKTQTASPMSPAKPAPRAVELKLYVISSNAP